jgi:transposase
MKTIKEISEFFSVTVPTVHYWIKKYNLKTHKCFQPGRKSQKYLDLDEVKKVLNYVGQEVATNEL